MTTEDLLTINRMEQLGEFHEEVTKAIASHVWRSIRLARFWHDGEFHDTNLKPDAQDIIAEALALLACTLAEGQTLDGFVIMRAALDAGTQRRRPWNPAKDHNTTHRYASELGVSHTVLVAAHNNPNAPTIWQALADDHSQEQFPESPKTIDRELPDNWLRVLTAKLTYDTNGHLAAYSEA